jgi:hypothetical protein
VLDYIRLATAEPKQKKKKYCCVRHRFVIYVDCFSSESKIVSPYSSKKKKNRITLAVHEVLKLIKPGGYAGFFSFFFFPFFRLTKVEMVQNFHRECVVWAAGSNRQNELVNV